MHKHCFLFSSPSCSVMLSETTIRESTSDTGALENFLTYAASLPKPKFYWGLFVTSSTQMTATWSHTQNPICSLDKTVVMFQPALGTVYVEPSIYIDGKELNVIDKFTYLGSTINRFCSLDDKISSRLKKATGAFSALKDCVWS